MLYPLLIVYVLLTFFKAACLAMTIRVRKSSLQDLDAIAKVVAASSYQEPSNAYKYPTRDRYPNDAYECTRNDYLKYIRNDEHRWHCMVTEKVKDNEAEATIISVALWEVSAVPELIPKESSPPPSSTDQAVLSNETCTRHDAAPERIQAWKKFLPAYRKAHMSGVWGPNLHLQFIGTQPEYQRHGAATALMKWGLATAEENNLWIGLFASPIGALFYRHIGFKDVGNVTVQVEGEDESVVVMAMGFPPPTKDHKLEGAGEL